MSKSCIGCKFLYCQDFGYSNWTVEESMIDCAKDMNENLPDDEPCDWNHKEDADNWPKTNTSRCSEFSEGEMIVLDVEGFINPHEETDDAEQAEAVAKHSGWEDEHANH